MWKEVRSLESRKVTRAFPPALSKGGGGAFFITVLWEISWFIKIVLKQICCSYWRNKKIQNGFQSFLLLFWGQYCCWTETKISATICLFFISFLFPQLLYCFPCPTDFGVSEKEYEWKRSIATNKAHFFKPMFPPSYKNAQYHQNLRQKVFNRGALRLYAGRFDILKFDKLNWFVVFNTSNWGRGGLFGGLSPPKPPVATGLSATRPIGQWNLILAHLQYSETLWKH